MRLRMGYCDVDQPALCTLVLQSEEKRREFLLDEQWWEGQGDEEGRVRGAKGGEEEKRGEFLTSPFRTNFRVGYLLTRNGFEQRSPATNTDTKAITNKPLTREDHLEQW